MKKSIKFLTILVLVVTSLSFTSCGKDDDDNPAAVLTGNFTVSLDGVLFIEGTNADVGLIQDNDKTYQTLVTIGNTEVSIVVTGFPRKIGDVITMDTNGDPGIMITSGQDLYTTKSGTLTRTSASKISFNGKCKKLLDAQEYTITGSAESDAWKVIK